MRAVLRAARFSCCFGFLGCHSGPADARKEQIFAEINAILGSKVASRNAGVGELA
jgi:hypothetical protein